MYKDWLYVMDVQMLCWIKCGLVWDRKPIAVKQAEICHHESCVHQTVSCKGADCEHGPKVVTLKLA